MSGELVASEPERISTFAKGAVSLYIQYSTTPGTCSGVSYVERAGAVVCGYVLAGDGQWCVVGSRTSSPPTPSDPVIWLSLDVTFLFTTMLLSPCHFAGASFRRGSSQGRDDYDNP
jgi:hypothetical protein